MDSNASNYRAIATVNDVSCVYAGCLDSLAFNFDLSVTIPAQCIAVIIGCQDPHAANFCPAANSAFDAFTGQTTSCLYLGYTYPSRATMTHVPPRTHASARESSPAAPARMRSITIKHVRCP